MRPVELRRPLLRHSASAEWSPVSLFASGEKGMVYDPEKLSSLWQDSARTTPVTASGQAVGAMDDLSPNGWHMTQATSGLRPLYDINTGVAALLYDGTDDQMNATAAGSAFRNRTFGTIIAANKLNNVSGIRICAIVGVGIDYGAGRLALAYAGNARNTQRRVDTDSFFANYITPSSLETWSVEIGEASWGTAENYISQNHGARNIGATGQGSGSTSDTDTQAPGPSFSYGSGGAVPWSGHIGRTIFINRELTPTEKTNAINWCLWHPRLLFANGEKGMIYDPSDLRTLWQDSARTTRITASTNPVGAMDDLSPNGWHMTQATSTARPLYNDSASIKSLVYDGTDDLLSSIVAASVFRNKTFGTLIAAIKATATGVLGVGPIVNTGASATAGRLTITKDTTDVMRTTTRRLDADTPTVNATLTNILNTWAVCVSEADWTNALCHSSVNLGARTTVATGSAGSTSDTDSLTPGPSTNQSAFLAGSQGRMICIDRALTPAERTKAIQWCGLGAGLAL